MNIKNKTATHYLPNPKGEPQLYYRVNETKFSDGTISIGLEYYSPDFETWRGSNERNIEEYIKNKLVKI